jgi:hypothetical protein
MLGKELSPTFQLWDAADAADRRAWLEAWTSWPDREVFAHPDYVRLYTGSGERALCAAQAVSGSFVLYPFLLRSLDREPYCVGSLRGYTDTTTPYGYGGPFGWGEPWTSEAIGAFWSEFQAWATSARVVSEVMRLSLFPETLAAHGAESRVIAENVVCELNPEEVLWKRFEHKVRKNVNKARASGVVVNLDGTGASLDDFLRIYSGTMSRRNAGEGYYFPREYFESIHESLGGHFMYFHAKLDETIVSTELVLVSAERVYSFLGGTDEAWFHVRPNDLLKLEIMNWARSEGKKQFVLGGGYGNGDGIYKYKLAFAPTGSTPFSLGSRIRDQLAYVRLTEARQAHLASHGEAWQPNPSYFPAYRA